VADDFLDVVIVFAGIARCIEGELVALQGVLHVFVGLFDGRQQAFVVGLGRVDLLHDAKDTVVEMVEELLCIDKVVATCRAAARNAIGCHGGLA